MKYLIFNTEAEAQTRCDELTVAYKQLMKDDTIAEKYAVPVEGLNGWYVPIVKGAESLFTQSEIGSAAEYERLPDVEQFVFEV